MKLPSVAVAGVFNDRKMIHRTGISEHTATTRIAADHPPTCLW
jgi:hypothetical protein